jgi:hypothetical protein
VFSALRGAYSGAADIARKTNFSFERREREKNKAASAALKAQAKAEKKAGGQQPEADDNETSSSIDTDD